MALTPVLWDLFLLFAIAALILWILGMVGVFHLGGLMHIFIAIAIVCFLLWICFRVIGIVCWGGHYGRKGAI